MVNKRNVMLIHGAWSSRNSFNYLSTMIDINFGHIIKHTIFFEYDPIKESLADIILRANRELDDYTNTNTNTDTLVVGHSLGGLIALALSDHPNSYYTITMASPLSGIKVESLFQPFMYSRAPVLYHVSPNSALVKQLHKKEYVKPVNCLITTKGFNPLMIEKSDGVVSVASQDTWLPTSGVATYVDCNHYDILQSEQAFQSIKCALTLKK
jgi:pimeloyl-ACP methyl ester carboxylesterase